MNYSRCFEDEFKIQIHFLKKGKYLPRLCGRRRLSARFSSLLAQIGKLDSWIRWWEEKKMNILRRIQTRSSFPYDRENSAFAGK